ncbi:MAG: glycosyltransferase, partial [Liquorilactobacillus satsumensis]
PLISVIIPVFNTCGYLIDLFQNIKTQELTNVELIFVDDGSTDGSDLLLDKLGSQICAKVFHQPNQGVAAARNKGIANAKGTYLCFIDPDDKISDNYFALLLYGVKNSNADIILTSWAEVYGKESNLHTLVKQNSSLETMQRLNPMETISTILKSRNMIGGVVWGKVFKSTLFREDRFPLIRITSDAFQCYRSLLQAKTICYIRDATYLYSSSRNSSITHLSLSIEDIQQQFKEIEKSMELISAKYPNLRAVCENLIGHFAMQECRYICQSNSVREKKRWFKNYQKKLKSHYGSLMEDSACSASEKIWYCIIYSGYPMTRILIKILPALQRFMVK